MEYRHGRFTTTNTPCQISYVGIRRISTGTEKICHNSHSTMAPSARLCPDGDDNDDDDDDDE